MNQHPDFLLRLGARANRLPVRGRCLLVALSGGLDSSVLLHGLARLAGEAGFTLEAAHVHHGLNAQADHWLAHCRQICAALGVPLHECRVNLAREQGRGLEAAAREARHAALQAIASDWIVLAHHRSDQAETVLHRLLRGAGVHGAGAMRERDPARRLWRPLLDESRSQLLAWAQGQGMSWVEDDSNTNTAFTRNYLRQRIMPALAERFVASEANLARAAQHFAEGADLLDALAQIDADAVVMGGPGSRERLRGLSGARARNLLRHLLAQTGARMPDSARLDDVLHQLLGAAAVRLLLDKVAICAYRDRIWLEENIVESFESRIWQGEQTLPWGRGALHFTAITSGGFRLVPGQTLLTAHRPEDRLRLHANGPSRPFRLLCQESAIPPWRRSSLPVLRQNGAVLWIGGLGTDIGCRAGPGEAGWTVHWVSSFMAGSYGEEALLLK